MTDFFLALILVAVIVTVVLEVALLWRTWTTPARDGLPEIRSSLAKLEGAIVALERVTKDDFSRLRQESAGQDQAFKLEVVTALKQDAESMFQRLDSFSSDTNQKIELLRGSVSDSGHHLQTLVGAELEKVRLSVGQAGDQIRHAVDERLEQMRQTVDEKLQNTLEARLGESFRTVTEQLNAVHKGLGEMQSLASGVGDLKRVLTNVKARGTWGEVQLGALLEEILRPEQYDRNVPVTGTAERVDFAVRLPGGEDGQPRWLPVDAKFPVEDYQRILDASEAGDAAALDKATRGLESTLRACAKDIHDKYILEPKTTGFAVLFLATEGLYAEALRRSGLAESIQRDFSVMLAGPTTFAALLTSLRVGFRTFTIERKASEVAERLAEVKTAFSRYAGLLGKVKTKLQQASTAVDMAERSTKNIQLALGAVESEAVLLESDMEANQQVEANHQQMAAGVGL